LEREIFPKAPLSAFTETKLPLWFAHANGQASAELAGTIMENLMPFRLFASALAVAAAMSATSGAGAMEVANGLTLNGLTLNGLTLNGLTLNGLTLNGLTLNGLSANGWSQNGLSANGLATNGLSANGTASATAHIEAVILQDGSFATLK
jgi:hypothetical protein